MDNNNEKGKIKKEIESLREILNEICVTADDAETLKKRLLVSEHLDKLIVKYLNIENK